MSSRRTDNIKALSEKLGSLQITEEALSNNKQTDTKMSGTPVPAAISKNIQAGMLKNMVLNPGQFDGNQTKFKDWWIGIRLFLKSNRVIETDDRIIAILACLRRGVVGIYAQKKLNKLDKELRTQDWEEFIQEIKMIFSDKTKAVDAKWKIEMFK